MLDKIKRCLLLPYKFLRRLTFSRIRTFFKLLKKEGFGGTWKRLQECIYGTELYRKKYIVNSVKRIKKIEDCEEITFLYQEQPMVSIVIPVYNEFNFTYNCLKSIANMEDSTSYEIILADDHSSDLTREIEKKVKNIRVIRSEENLRFLLNCNHAAKYARGRYILFLNNDTQVQNQWLDALVDLMEKDEKTGMAGSKMIYPDMRLQEAGGIIWKDGTAANYGNRQDPYAPKYNYVREVDYISGASIMIRTSLWKKIGGFDERFAPAYCEDSDLAFAVRKEGYKVVYQPLSVIIHFEGVSNGTDIASGLKQYQVENAVKLYKKWKTEMDRQYPAEAGCFKARERGREKKVIVFVDHYVPTIDCDAGSKTIYEFLQMFIKKGYCIKFVGDNFAQSEPYTTILQQLGIEVLYGDYYQKHIFEWFDENKQFIDFVFLNRPHISIKYIDYFAEKTNIKIIYYGHDLHFLRIKREYELTGDVKKLDESEEWLKKELYLMRHADISYYPSVIEQQEIHKIDPNIRVKAITAYTYDTFRQDIDYDFSKRKGILFVGGFVHEPNQDAVIWFVNEIYPHICRKEKIPFYIVGSHPTVEINRLNGKDGIIVKGFVSDEKLEKLYRECKLVVVPLRYGAGVKGKVVEAMYHGVPIVTTKVGAEGIEAVENAAVIADDEKEFAKTVLKLYHDNAKLAVMAEQSQILIRKYFSMEAVWERIEEDFL